MKLRILSDIHLEHDPSYRLVHYGEDAVLCAGDLSSWHTRDLAEQFIRSSRVPFYYVLGNHDFYHGDFGEVLDYYCSLHGQGNFRFLHNTCVGLGDFVLVGTPLWTDFNLYGTPERSMDLARTSINDFNYTRVGQELLTPEHLREWNAGVREFLRASLTVKNPTHYIVMTHWCPSAETINPVYAGDPLNPYFATECRELMGSHPRQRRGNVVLWVHGHSHMADDRVINGTRVIRNPKGYPQERSQWNEGLIVAV